MAHILNKAWHHTRRVGVNRYNFLLQSLEDLDNG